MGELPDGWATVGRSVAMSGLIIWLVVVHMLVLYMDVVAINRPLSTCVFIYHGFRNVPDGLDGPDVG